MENRFSKLEKASHPFWIIYIFSGRSPVLALVLLTILVFSACQKEEDSPLTEPLYLVEAKLIAEYTTSEIIDILDETGYIPEAVSFHLAKYDIAVYRLIYNTTDTGGGEILASGALIVPKGADPLPLLSFQHGTLSSDEDAPSNFSSAEYFASALYSSSGYVIALPDYLGYGISKQIEHPYQHGSSLATASRDMLRAVREFDIMNGEFKTNDKLFLTGYSEGGYATVSLMKLLEEQHGDEFAITAVTAGAGAYNKSLFAIYIMETERDLVYLNHFLWVLDTYNQIYGLNRPYSYFFNEPYSSIIKEGGVFANTQLNPHTLFSDNFRAGIIEGTDTELIDILADNDRYNWKPQSPLQLYHGTADDFVFYFNSETAHEAMVANGAAHVELVAVEGGDHVSTLFSYLTGTLLFFSSYQ